MLTIMRLARGGTLVAVVLACAAAPAQAQFGSLKSRVKEKVAEKTAEKVVDKALGGKEAPAGEPAKEAGGAPAGNAGGAAAAASGRADGRTATADPRRRSPYNEFVLEMTPEVMDRLATAIAAETAERKAIPARKREFEAANQKFATCYSTFLQSPEMEKIGERLEQASKKNDMDLLMKVSADQQALIKAKCGESPSEPDYERLAEEKAREAGAFENRQYDILKERVTPFCKAGQALTPDGDGVRIGDSRIAYVYSATEVQQLKSRCGSLAAALDAVL